MVSIFNGFMDKLYQMAEFYNAQEKQYEKDLGKTLKMFDPKAVNICDRPGEKMVHSSYTQRFQVSNGTTGYYTFEHSMVDGVWPAEETCYVKQQEGDKLVAVCKGSISPGHVLSQLKGIYDPESKVSSHTYEEAINVGGYRVFLFSSEEELEKRMSGICKSETIRALVPDPAPPPYANDRP